MTVFSYYSNEYESDLLRAMRTLALFTPLGANGSLVLLCDDEPDDLVLEELRSSFNAIALTKRSFVRGIETVLSEIIMIHNTIDLLYVDPRTVFLHNMSISKDRSTFFLRKDNLATTKVCFLKASCGLKMNLQPTRQSSLVAKLSDQIFTRFINFNFLMRKVLVNGVELASKYQYEAARAIPGATCIIDTEGIKPTLDNSLSKTINSVDSRSYDFLSNPFVRKPLNLKLAKVVNVYRIHHVNVPRSVSFIVPAWKSAEFLEECLDSIQMQRCSKEILLGIDRCPETLAKLNEIRHKYENLKVYWFRQNCGPYVIKNTLAQIAKTGLLCFIDADDILNSNYCDVALSHIKKKSMFRCRFTNFYIDEPNKLEVSNFEAYGQILINKDDFLAINGYWGVRVGADQDFVHRFSSTGWYTDILCDAPLFKRRIHDNNLTRSETVGMGTDIRNDIIDKFKQRREDGVFKNLKLAATNYYKKV